MSKQVTGFSVVDEFVNLLKKGREDLGLHEIAEKEKELLNITEQFSQQIESCFKTLTDNTSKITFQSEMEEIQKKIKTICEKWATDIKEAHHAQEFIRKFEQTFLVTVFGKVNSGKSSLGNFILGKSFKEASFDNPYKKITLPTVEIHDQTSKKHMREAEKAKDIYEFEENATEATSVIQSFTFESLSWADTPGIGAVKNPELDRNNEDLAKQYVNYADLVIFLTPSDAPGVQQEFAELKVLQENNKQVLLMISKSDVFEEDCDEEGEIIQVLYPKSEEDRCKQEAYLKAELQKSGVIGNIEGAETLSISVQLAKQALKKNDQKLFTQSGLEAFYQILMKIFSEKSIEYKRNNPRANFNRVINTLVGKSAVSQNHSDGSKPESNSLQCLKDRISQMRTKINHLKKKIQDLEDKLPKSVNEILETEIFKLFKNVKEGDTAWKNQLITITEEILDEHLKQTLEKEIKEIANDIQMKKTESMALDGLNVQKKVERISYQKARQEKRRRDPKGVIERVCSSVLGKKYHNYQTVYDTEVIEVNLGTNQNQVREEALNTTKNFVKKTIESTFDNFTNNFINPLTETLHNLDDVIKKTNNQLNELKFNNTNKV